MKDREIPKVRQKAPDKTMPGGVFSPRLVRTKTSTNFLVSSPRLISENHVTKDDVKKDDNESIGYKK